MLYFTAFVNLYIAIYVVYNYMIYKILLMLLQFAIPPSEIIRLVRNRTIFTYPS